jgi:isopenicillin N synthase-like dioxygenase
LAEHVLLAIGESSLGYFPFSRLTCRSRNFKWPSQLPELRQIVELYIQQLTALGERFLRLVAEALSLPEDTFLPFLSEQHRLKLVHYPGTALPHGESSPNFSTQGVGPHKDSSGWWTFLLQASPPHIKGLQALNKDGDWIDVPVIPGTFVVNIGQAFEVVTNGVCKATTHRVVMPPGTEDRYSVPFFQGVRRDLTKRVAVETLKDHFEAYRRGEIGEKTGLESSEAKDIDSAFLRGKYDTWGESQLRTKIRSHRDVGRAFYGAVYDKYIHDD